MNQRAKMVLKSTFVLKSQGKGRVIVSKRQHRLSFVIKAYHVVLSQNECHVLEDKSCKLQTHMHHNTQTLTCCRSFREEID